MRKLTITTTKRKQVFDITDLIQRELKSGAGVCHLFIAHTTSALTTADLDPGTDLDMLDAFREIIPKLDYRHPHDPSHVGDHILSSLIGSSLVVPFTERKLILGTWQRLVLIEFSGPRKRTVYMTTLKG